MLKAALTKSQRENVSLEETNELHIIDFVFFCATMYIFVSVCVVTGHRVQILRVDVLVAEAVEAYSVGELQPEVTFISIAVYCIICLW